MNHLMNFLRIYMIIISVHNKCLRLLLIQSKKNFKTINILIIKINKKVKIKLQKI